MMPTSFKPSVLISCVVFLTIVGPTSHAKIKDIKIRGYVTSVISQSVFEIEDYRITRDEDFRLEFENANPELTFKLQDIRIGTELEIRGRYNDETGELHAKSIKIDMEQFKTLKQTAILLRSPEGITRSAEGWSGTFYADGQRIRVSPSTQVLFKLTSREKKIVKEQEKQKKQKSPELPKSPEEEQGEFRPLESLAEVTPGTTMTYEGRRHPDDGSIVAERVEFQLNDLEKGEAELWKRIKVKMKPGDVHSLKPGELNITNVGKFKLHPDNEIQAYLSDLGKSLVPKYYETLPDDNPAKLKFQFFVVLDKDPNAFALPNGIIVFHSSMFDLFENEAQLAAVLGHEIAHSVQEHTWRQMQYHKKKLIALSIGAAIAGAYGLRSVEDIANLIVGAVRNGYSRSLENQADRVGLEYMLEAGYDPREAPRLWKLMTKAFGLQQTNFFWSSHDNQATRRSYLMNELKNNYSNLDYSQFRKGEEPFTRIKERMQNLSTRKKTVKVKT